MLLDELRALGADTDDGLDRFAGSTALYEKYLRKFPAACAEREVLPCFESGDLEGALANAHTLKGMTGNISLTVLFEAYSEVVALLRSGEPARAREVLEAALPKQAAIIECIKRHT